MGWESKNPVPACGTGFLPRRSTMPALGSSRNLPDPDELDLLDLLDQPDRLNGGLGTHGASTLKKCQTPPRHARRGFVGEVVTGNAAASFGSESRAHPRHGRSWWGFAWEHLKCWCRQRPAAQCFGWSPRSAITPSSRCRRCRSDTDSGPDPVFTSSPSRKLLPPIALPVEGLLGGWWWRSALCAATQVRNRPGRFRSKPRSARPKSATRPKPGTQI